MESYKIQVGVYLNNRISGVLGMIARDFAKTEAAAARLKAGIREIQLLGAAGFLIGGAGFAGLAIIRSSLEEAKKLQQAVAKFSTFGMGDAANQDALRFAKSMNIAGSSYVDNMNHMIEAQGVFRESGKLTLAEQLRGAKLAAPILAKMDFANQILAPDQTGSRHLSALAMLRFVETRGGVNDPKEFNRIANLGYKAIQSSGGNISWELLRQFMATGGTAAQGLTDQTLFGKFEPLIGELKSRAGTALMTAYNRLEGITKVPNQTAQLFVESGLWRRDDINWNTLGGVKRLRDYKSPLTDSKTFDTDPVQFYTQTMLPLYRKMGLDQAGILRENAVIFGRTGGLLFNLINRQLPAIMRSVASQNKALGIDDAVQKASNTALGRELMMRTDIKNIEASMGSAILPLYLAGLKALEPVLWAVSSWAERSPSEVKAVMYAFLGLSSAMAFGGTVLLLTAAFKGLRLILSTMGLVSAAGAAAGGGSTGAAVAGGAAVARGVLGVTPVGWAAALLGGLFYMGSRADAQRAAYGRASPWEQLHMREDQSNIMFTQNAAKWYQVRGGKLVYVPESNAQKIADMRNQTSGVKQTEELIDAFKKWLSGVSINMDGRKVGNAVAAGMVRAGGPTAHATTRFNAASIRETP